MPSRTASVPSRQVSSSARKMSISVPTSSGSTCCASRLRPASSSGPAIAWCTARRRLIAVNRPSAAAVGGDEQLAIGRRDLPEIVAGDVADHQHPGIGWVIERRRQRREHRRRRQMADTGAALGGCPIRVVVTGAIAQGGRGDQGAVRRTQHHLGERAHRIDPVAAEADVDLAAVDSLHRKPVENSGGRSAAKDRSIARQPASGSVARRRMLRHRLSMRWRVPVSSVSASASRRASRARASVCSGAAISASASANAAAASVSPGIGGRISASRL